MHTCTAHSDPKSWDIVMGLLSWAPSFLLSLVTFRFLSFPSLLSPPGSWALVSLLCLTRFTTVLTSGVNQQEDTEKKKPMGDCPTLISDWRWRFCSLRVQHFLSGSVVKNPLVMQETQEIQVWSLGREDPLEEGMATHSSILPRKILWTEESGRLQPYTFDS